MKKVVRKFEIVYTDTDVNQRCFSDCKQKNFTLLLFFDVQCRGTMEQIGSRHYKHFEANATKHAAHQNSYKKF